MTDQEMEQATQHKLDLVRQHRDQNKGRYNVIAAPKSKDEAYQYLIDNGEGKLVDAAIANGMSDEEIIDAVHDIMLADAEDNESSPPGEDELKWEDIFGEPRPQEEEGDDEDWEKIFGEPKPKDEPQDPSEEYRYEDDPYAGLPEHIKARYQLAEQKAQYAVEMWRKHLGDMAELHHENDRYKERLFDILSGIHGQVLRSEREPDQPGATFKHVLQMAQGMGVQNPPTGSMPELLKAIADHTQAQSQHVPMVDMYHRQAETLASKPDSPQHRIDVYGYYRRLPDEHAARVAKRMGIEPGATPKDTRFRIASHIHSRTLGHPANKLPDTPDKMPTQKLQNTPVDSRAPTVAK